MKMSMTAKENMGYQFRVYPNTVQKDFFEKTFGCCRLLYNKMLEDKQKHYHQTGKWFYCKPTDYYNEYPFLREVDSRALNRVYLNLDRAYKNFFNNQEDYHFPKFKCKYRSKNSFTTDQNRGRHTIKIVDGQIKLPKVGLVKAVIHRPLPDDAVIKSATVTKTKSGKYYITLKIEQAAQNVPPVLPSPDKTLGLDFSFRDFYVDSNGHSPGNPHFYRQLENKLKHEQKKLARQEKGSNNWVKQKQKIETIQEKIANQRKNFCHQQSRQIANAYDAVCVEEIPLDAYAGSKAYGKAMFDCGFGMFRNFLKYKLAEQGKSFITIDKWFPSSRKCHNCGFVNHNLKVNEKQWTCPGCGHTLDRDWNAAMNIRDEGLRQIDI